MFAPKVAKAHPKEGAGAASSAALKRSSSLAHHYGTDQDALEPQAMMPGLEKQRNSIATGSKPSGDQNQHATPASLRGKDAPLGATKDFSGIPVFGPGVSSPSPVRLGIYAPSMPPKLAVGKVNDPAEHEADRLAEAVMNIPDPSLGLTSPPSQFKRTNDQRENIVQTKTATSSQPFTAEAPGIVHEALRLPGRPLDADTRTLFEPRFGRDFGAVRIHDDQHASQSARAINARAYTVGSQILFSSGQYDPMSQKGRSLLAHELGHVMQQSEWRSLQLQAKPDGNTSFVPAPAAGVSPPSPPVPGTPEAIKSEAIEVGEQWGSLLGERDVALDTLQAKWSGVSVWDRMTPEQKANWARDAENLFAKLPSPPKQSKSDLVAAQEEGFKIGVERGYSAAKLSAFLVKLGAELAIALFSGLAARGVRLPGFIANLLERSVPRLVAPGTGAAFGQKMAEEMLEKGVQGNPFREFIARLNAAPVRLPANEAAEAIRVATKVVSRGTMGTMPPVQQGDILVVPSRAPIPNAPVIGIRSNGTVMLGRAPKLEIITQDASGTPIFPPESRITGPIKWE